MGRKGEASVRVCSKPQSQWTHSERFRIIVFQKAVSKYKAELKRHEEGKCDLYRTRSTNKSQRRKTYERHLVQRKEGRRRKGNNKRAGSTLFKRRVDQEDKREDESM